LSEKMKLVQQTAIPNDIMLTSVKKIAPTVAACKSEAINFPQEGTACRVTLWCCRCLAYTKKGKRLS